jgi:hypothetical protein
VTEASSEADNHNRQKAFLSQAPHSAAKCPVNNGTVPVAKASGRVPDYYFSAAQILLGQTVEH